MLFQTIDAVGRLAVKVNELTTATAELVEVTKAVHRERVVRLRQELEEAKGDDNRTRNNFSMFWIQERLAALETMTGGQIPKPNGVSPSTDSPEPKGADSS